MAGSATCLNCKSGKYSDSGAVACIDCGTGQYTSSESRSFCLRCKEGKYSSGTGASLCNECSAGKYTHTNYAISIECSSSLNNSLCSLNLQCLQTDCSQGIIGRYIPGEMYENLEDMTIKIIAPKPAIIEISFTEFATEPDYDVLLIYSCTESSCLNQTQLASLSGLTKPSSVNSTTGIMKLVWSSEFCCPKPSSLCFCDDPAKAKILTGWKAAFSVHGASSCINCPSGSDSLIPVSSADSLLCTNCSNIICTPETNPVSVSGFSKVSENGSLRRKQLFRNQLHTFELSDGEQIDLIRHVFLEDWGDETELLVSEQHTAPTQLEAQNVHQIFAAANDWKIKKSSKKVEYKKQISKCSRFKAYESCEYFVRRLSKRQESPFGQLLGSLNLFSSDSEANVQSQRRFYDQLIFQMCGGGNEAAYGPCIASTFKKLQVTGFQYDERTAYPGIPLEINVEKLDAYDQLIITDSSSVIQIYGKYGDNEYGNKLTLAIAGTSIARMDLGAVNFSVAIKPSFVRGKNGLTIVNQKAFIFVSGADSQTLSGALQMQSPLEEILFSSDINVCPPGYVLVLDGSNVNTPRPGRCSFCNPGTYSVSPLYSPTDSDPACLNCPVGGNCSNGGNQVSFALGTWAVSSGIFRLLSCPPGFELLNSIGGVFSQDAQQCITCPAAYYCYGTASPIPCPAGSFSPPGSNSSSACTFAVIVQISVLLPESKSEFGADNQIRFVRAIAAASGSTEGVLH